MEDQTEENRNSGLAKTEESDESAWQSSAGDVPAGAGSRNTVRAASAAGNRNTAGAASAGAGDPGAAELISADGEEETIQPAKSRADLAREQRMQRAALFAEMRQNPGAGESRRSTGEEKPRRSISGKPRRRIGAVRTQDGTGGKRVRSGMETGSVHPVAGTVKSHSETGMRRAYSGTDAERTHRTAVSGNPAVPIGIFCAIAAVVVIAAIAGLQVSRRGSSAGLSAEGQPVAAVGETETAEPQTEAALEAADAGTGEAANAGAQEAAADGLEGQAKTGSPADALASLTAAFSGQSLTAAETEAQTYSNDEAGNFVVPARQEGSFETEPAWASTLVSTGDATLDEANRLAAGYDYDGAIALLQSVAGYESNQAYTDAIAEYTSEQASCTAYAPMSDITHVFFHTLVVDTSRAFNDSIAISKQDGTNKVQAYNEVMTTVDEFCRIISDMYEEGYVLVGLHDIAAMTDNGDGTQTMQFKEILLPPGKKPFVLSVDDVSYYEYMTGHGFASKLVVDENGKVTNEYDNPDGSVIYGSYDVLPILEDFIAAHPDFSYRGARGTIALTGYEGVFGYRTSDYWYNWNCDYFNQDFAAKRESMYYNNENIEQDKATAKQVADAIKALGWTFASHSWGHRDMGSISYDDFVWDSDMWEKEVQPIVGDTDIIIFPKGADIDSWRGYAADNQKFLYLKSLGFDYFCNVDSTQYWIQIGERGDYFRMGRRNLDGTRMWEAIESYVSPGSATDRLSDLFDSRTVFDWSRPTPVE